MSTPDSTEPSAARQLLGRKKAASGPHAPRALEHMALAILTANGAGVTEALAALERLRQDFIDWNEIRVVRSQELARSLGDIPGAEKSARDIRSEYNSFFEKRGALHFTFLSAGKPSEMRRHMAKTIPLIGKAATALLLYEFCPGAPLPLSEEGLRRARHDGVAGKTGDRNQLSRTLADELNPAEAALLVQYWELEATGSPYGERPAKPKEPATKKNKKAAAKAKKIENEK